ncbi:MAG: NTPase [Sulfolobales archaeon]
MIITITGKPGIGKTTVFTKVVNDVKQHGLVVGGFVCPEVRSGGVRVGFKIIDMMSGSQGWLARILDDCPNQLRVGRYCIDVDDAVGIGVEAVMKAVNDADLLCIDEIGPMELKVGQLRDAIIYALGGSKNLLAVIHWRLNDPTITELLKTSTKYEVTFSNRDFLPNIIVNELLKNLRKH